MAKIYVGRSTTVQNLLFCTHTLCMTYVNKIFSIDYFSVRNELLLCFMHGQDQKKRTKLYNYSLHNKHSLLSTDGLPTEVNCKIKLKDSLA